MIIKYKQTVIPNFIALSERDNLSDSDYEKYNRKTNIHQSLRLKDELGFLLEVFECNFFSKDYLLDWEMRKRLYSNKVEVTDKQIHDAVKQFIQIYHTVNKFMRMEFDTDTEEFRQAMFDFQNKGMINKVAVFKGAAFSIDTLSLVKARWMYNNLCNSWEEMKIQELFETYLPKQFKHVTNLWK